MIFSVGSAEFVGPVSNQTEDDKKSAQGIDVIRKTFGPETFETNRLDNNDLSISSNIVSLCASPLIMGYVTNAGELHLNGLKSLIPGPDVSNKFSRLQFKEIAVGSDHVVIITKYGGRALTWGSNKYGQLGRSIPCVGNDNAGGGLYTKIPDYIDTDLKSEVVAIACGDSHSLALCKDGNLYSWGRNDYGQLGRSGHSAPQEDKSKPLIDRINLLSDVHKREIQCIAAGALHSAVVCDFKLYTFGWGIYGQLGHGLSQNEYIPKQVEGLTGIGTTIDGGRSFQDVKFVACGTWHTTVVSTVGDVYSFGWNKFNQVVPSPNHTSSKPDAERQYFLPTLVPLDIEHNAVRVSCGSRHTAVLYDNFELLAYGEFSLSGKEEYTFENNTEDDMNNGFKYFPPNFVVHKKTKGGTGSRVRCSMPISSNWCIYGLMKTK